MRTSPLLLALSLALVASPAALSGHPSPPGADPSPTPAKAHGPKGTHHLLHACVTTDAADAAVPLKVLGGNRHMRDVLDGATTFTAKLDEDTLVRLVGKARLLPEGSVPTRAPRIGTFADLDAGDRVIVRFRAERDLEPDGLPAAFRVIDRGPTATCAVPEATPPSGEEPPAL